MSKFIYDGTLNEKYVAGTILSDNVEANKVSVNTLDSTREDINVLKNVSIDGDLSVSGDINIDDVDISTIKTNTITSDNSKIDFNKGINTTKYLSIGNNNYNITTDGGLCLGNFAASPYNDGVFKIGIGTGNNDRQTGLLFDNNGTLNVKNKIITNDLQSKNGNNIIKIYDNSIEISKDGGTNWTGLISAGTGNNSVVFGSRNNIASGNNSFCEGEHNGSAWGAFGERSHCEGYQNFAQGNNSHAEGYRTTAKYNAHSEGASTTASGNNSHAEGDNTKAYGLSSHAEGNNTTASGNNSHAEGYNTQTLSGNYPSHSEGSNTKTRGESAHAEGHVDGNDSGSRTINNITYYLGANNKGSHCEGHNTIAQGIASHAEGGETVALSNYSHSGGFHTISNTIAGTAIGKYNISGNNKLFVVGNGTDDNNRSDAFVVYDNGNILLNNTLFRSGSGNSQFLTYAQQNYANNDNSTRSISNDDFSYYIIGDIVNITIPLRSSYKFVSSYRSRNDLANDFVDDYLLNIDLSNIKSSLDTYYNATTSSFNFTFKQDIYISNNQINNSSYLLTISNNTNYANQYSLGVVLIINSKGPASGKKDGDYGIYYIKDFSGFSQNQCLTITFKYVKLT